MLVEIVFLPFVVILAGTTTLFALKTRSASRSADFWHAMYQSADTNERKLRRELDQHKAKHREISRLGGLARGAQLTHDATERRATTRAAIASCQFRPREEVVKGVIDNRKSRADVAA